MRVQRTRALASWRTLLEHPVARMNAEEQYHKLLKAADQMELVGLINGDEWRQLVRKAGAYFISAGTAAAEATPGSPVHGDCGGRLNKTAVMGSRD